MLMRQTKPTDSSTKPKCYNLKPTLLTSPKTQSPIPSRSNDATGYEKCSKDGKKETLNTNQTTNKPQTSSKPRAHATKQRIYQHCCNKPRSCCSKVSCLVFLLRTLMDSTIIRDLRERSGHHIHEKEKHQHRSQQ